MGRIRFVHITILVLLTTTVLAGASSRLTQELSTGKLRGSVFDPHEALIPNVKLIVTGETVRREVLSNDSGQFVTELPAGVYHIRSEQGVYYPIQRAAFRVSANSTTVINLRPALRVTSIATEITKAGLREPMMFGPTPHYESLRPAANSPLDLLVQFEKKTHRGRLVEYQNAWITFDSLLIYADRIQVDKGRLRIVAKGQVIVEDNGKPTQGNELVLTFDKDQPQWSIR